MSLLEVTRLNIRYTDTPQPVVSNVSLKVEAGQSLGIVGESGSGKTQTAMAIMGLLPANAETAGSIRFDGQEILGAPAAALNRYRASRIAMIFQDPMTALNPYVRIGDQLRRILLEHRMCNAAEAKRRTLAMLEKVGLPDAERQFRAYPHQLSGGMRQRVMIGAALIGQPDLLVADEPTTALDVTIQAQILGLLRELRTQSNTALLLITHDLSVVAGTCDDLVMMNEGRLVEEGTTQKVILTPQHERTARLIACSPRLDMTTRVTPLAAESKPIIEIDDIAVSFRERRKGRFGQLHAVRTMSLKLAAGETLSIVGESGSGKTSLARAVLGLVAAKSGTLRFQGEQIPGRVQARSNAILRQLQMVFQDPANSLNPAMRVAEIIEEPIAVHDPSLSKADREKAVNEMLQHVHLSIDLRDRYPHELSGGQAQRVAIARALVIKPTVLVCDEAVSALDSTTQNEILNLLQAEQKQAGLSLVFITHDLSVVRLISHRVLVLYLGRVCEVADSKDLFKRPRHPYTKALLEAVSMPQSGDEPQQAPLVGEVASILNPPPGCPFHPRCEHAVAKCSSEVPQLQSIDGTRVACHRASELDLSY
ncbi:MAG: ABC transporter ATP-binding protein [Woeseiaceae bacterium]|nr:ABC transporter ATP-binding protein [Woeseiaceae bacterium]